MSSARQYCTFLLNQMLFGIDVQQVQEVVMDIGLTRVPLSADIVVGLINLRGQILAAVDLRSCLGFPARNGQRIVSLIVRTREGMLSYLVDKMGDVLEVDERLFEEPPGTLLGVGTDLIAGAYKMEGQLLHIVDSDKVLELILSRRDENVRHATG